MRKAKAEPATVTSPFQTVLQQIQKDHGKESIVALDGSTIQKGFPHISTGSLALDKATGIGGLPQGRVVEIYGVESAGKTLLTLHVIRNAQKMGFQCGFIDAEHALDTNWARTMGVDVDKLLFSQPDSGEQALEIVETMVRSGLVQVIVVDSVAALVPKAELEGDMGQAHMGLQARLMSQALRKLTAIVGKHNCLVIFINQLRQKIGVFFGSPDKPTGGEALKFYASMRMDMRKIGRIERGEETIGHRIRVRIVKNKVAVPHTEAEFDSYFGTGFEPSADLLDMALDKGIIRKDGSWFKYNDMSLGQGRERAMECLKDPELFREVLSLAMSDDTIDVDEQKEELEQTQQTEPDKTDTDNT